MAERILRASIALAVGLLGTAGFADEFSLEWFTIDGGGDMLASDGQPDGFDLSGTIGQVDAGPLMTGDGFELVGGFWAGVPEPVCDFNADGVIGLSDLAQLLSNYGTASGMTYEDGDLDGDADVDLADLAALLAEYGTICP